LGEFGDLQVAEKRQKEQILIFEKSAPAGRPN
jgi:hypothetical protein